MVTWTPRNPKGEALRDAAERAKRLVWDGEQAQVLIGQDGPYPFVHLTLSFPLLDRAVIVLGANPDDNEVLVFSLLNGKRFSKPEYLMALASPTQAALDDAIDAYVTALRHQTEHLT